MGSHRGEPNRLKSLWILTVESQTASEEFVESQYWEPDFIDWIVIDWLLWIQILHRMDTEHWYRWLWYSIECIVVHGLDRLHRESALIVWLESSWSLSSICLIALHRHEDRFPFVLYCYRAYWYLLQVSVLVIDFPWVDCLTPFLTGVDEEIPIDQSTVDYLDDQVELQWARPVGLRRSCPYQLFRYLAWLALIFHFSSCCEIERLCFVFWRCSSR